MVICHIILKNRCSSVFLIEFKLDGLAIERNNVLWSIPPVSFGK